MDLGSTCDPAFQCFGPSGVGLGGVPGGSTAHWLVGVGGLVRRVWGDEEEEGRHDGLAEKCC